MEMKNKSKIRLLIFIGSFLVLTSFYLGRIYGDEDDFAGSDGDPLITKSYLEERLSGNLTGKNTAFQKISLTKNKTLYLDEGSTLILYQGSGKVVSKLLNINKGLIFENDNSLVKYNLFLAPSDNCGIIANDKMIVFVSGEYQIK